MKLKIFIIIILVQQKIWKILIPTKNHTNTVPFLFFFWKPPVVGNGIYFRFEHNRRGEREKR